jgi:hypothetical protein
VRCARRGGELRRLDSIEKSLQMLDSGPDAMVDEDEMVDWSEEAKAANAEWMALTHDQKMDRLRRGIAEAQAKVDEAIARGQVPPGTKTKDLTREERVRIFPESADDNDDD